MDIIKDQAIRTKWHRGFKRQSPPDELTLHGTGGPGTYKWVLMGFRKKYYMRGIGLFHYLIERTGKTIEIIDPMKWVYHSSSGKHDERTIGIELVNLSPGNLLPYTEKQYTSLFNLIEDLYDRFPIKIIRSHNVTKKIYSKSGLGKVCPGNFNWEKLSRYLSMMASKK